MSAPKPQSPNDRRVAFRGGEECSALDLARKFFGLLATSEEIDVRRAAPAGSFSGGVRFSFLNDGAVQVLTAHGIAVVRTELDATKWTLKVADDLAVAIAATRDGCIETGVHPRPDTRFVGDAFWSERCGALENALEDIWGRGGIPLSLVELYLASRPEWTKETTRFGVTWRRCAGLPDERVWMPVHVKNLSLSSIHDLARRDGATLTEFIARVYACATPRVERLFLWDAP